MTAYRIKDVARINRRALGEDTDPNYRFRYIDIGSIDGLGNITIPQGDIIFDRAPSRARRLAPPGSVVISTVRTYLRAIATVPETAGPLVFSTGFATLEAKSEVESGFLAYYCRSTQFIEEVVARSTGVNYPAINPSEIGTLPVSVPSVATQRRISDFLDAETARIDQLMEFRTAQQKSLDERAYAEVSSALIPGILERPIGYQSWPWLPAMIPGVPLVRLGYVCRLQNGVTVDGNKGVNGDTVTRPYLRVANVQAGHVNLDSVSEITVSRSVADRCALKVGDVLMTEGGDLDKLGRGTVWRGELADCLHQNHVFALRPNSEWLDGNYLALMTQTVHGRCYFESTGSRTTNLASTNSSKILSFPIPLPPLSRQQEIARRAQKKLEHISHAQNRLTVQLKLLAERRQALITAAVTGQFDVSTASGRNVTEGVSP